MERAGVGLAVALFTLGLCERAGADVRADAARLVRALAVQGTPATVLDPVFAFQGERAVRTVVPRGRSSARCRSIIGISERHVRFELRWRADASSPPVERPEAPPAGGRAGASAPRSSGGGGGAPELAGVQSTVGVAVLHECGERSDPARVEVAMRSMRAAVELVVAWHPGPLAPIGVLLPERRLTLADGPDGTSAAAAPPPLDVRLAATERQARQQGAAQILRVATRSEPRGQGAVRLRLAPGCHRIGVLAERLSVEGAPHDVDAELRRAGDRSVVATDRSVAPDARLEVCLGEAASVDVRFVGAPPRASIQIVDAHWPFPAQLAAAWEPATRATIGWGLWRRGELLTGVAEPVEFIGAQGATVVPLRLERAGCYLAVLGHTGGEASALRLTVRAGEQVSTDVALGPLLGAAVGFCAPDDAELAAATVELRGALAWWRLVLWRLPGAER